MENRNLPAVAKQGLQPIESVNALPPMSVGLRPAHTDDLLSQLSQALALVGSAGMSADDREEWLAAACIKLADVPADLLAEGIDYASSVADHPAKIIPAIMAEVTESWERRKRLARPITPSHLSIEPPREEFEYCSPEAAAAIRKEFGI